MIGPWVRTIVFFVERDLIRCQLKSINKFLSTFYCFSAELQKVFLKFFFLVSKSSKLE